MFFLSAVSLDLDEIWYARFIENSWSKDTCGEKSYMKTLFHSIYICKE